MTDQDPEIGVRLRKRSHGGRPRLEEDQPELLKAIVEIAMYGSGADERRRSDTIRTVQTLDDLTAELKLQGYMVRIALSKSVNF